MVKILQATANDAGDVAWLSFEVGRMHDKALPAYFMPSTGEVHLRIISEMN